MAAGGSKAHATTNTNPTTTSTAVTGTATAGATSTATSASATRTTVKPPAGGPVPPGFERTLFTATSAQHFWLLGTAPCSRTICTSIEAGAGAPIAIIARGASVWLSVCRASNRARHQTLIYSSDRGAHFTTESSPRVPGLGGTLAVVWFTALWAVYPIGMQARVARGTDAGARWSGAAGGQAASSTPRVALVNPAQRLWRTADGGLDWYGPARIG